MAYYYKNAVLEDKDLQNALKSLNPKFGDFVTRVAGEAWGLPFIDQKTKAIITIAVDVANQDQKGSSNPFGAHIDMALKQGATREEIEAVLLFLCVYTGFNKVASCARSSKFNSASRSSPLAKWRTSALSIISSPLGVSETSTPRRSCGSGLRATNCFASSLSMRLVIEPEVSINVCNN